MMKVMRFKYDTLPFLTKGKNYNVTNGMRDYYDLIDDTGGTISVHKSLFEEPRLQRLSCSIDKSEKYNKTEKNNNKNELATQYPHYYKDVSHLSHIDVYGVLKLFEVTDPCLQHAIKKLLALGSRGHKDHDKDFKDVIDSLNRYEIMKKEYENS